MLGAFYEKAWDLGRRVDANIQGTSGSPKARKRKQYSNDQKMHLRQTDETVQYTGAVGGGTRSSTNGHGKNQTARGSNPQHNVKWASEADISLSEEQSVDAVFDAILATWVLLLYRYNRDSLDQFSWSNKDQNDFHPVSLRGLYFPGLHDVSDLLKATQNLRFKDASSDKQSSLHLLLRDGIDDEVSVSLRTQKPRFLIGRSGH